MASRAYTSDYEKASLRGIEELRPWNVTDELAAVSGSLKSLLDIGCGVCRKTLPVASKFREVWGLEPSASMRAAAAKTAADSGLANVHLIAGVADNLPFADESFDVVCSFVAPHNAQEILRVLRPGGIAIVEKIGDRDKANIKELFGCDSRGPRGQFMGLRENEREQLLEEEFRRLFSKVQVRVGKWKTFLSREGLIDLCENTNTIRGFNKRKDAAAIDQVTLRFGTMQGIETVQHRILIVACKL